MTTSSSRRARTPVPTSRHRGRPRRLRAVGICLGVVAAIGLTVPTATASHYQASLEGSAFQIEDNANFVVDADAEATLDWNNVEEARQGDLATGTNDDSYSGGVKEDTACPTTTTGSIPNNKSDLKTFGVYVEPGASPGDPGYLHLYWTRVSDPSGTTLMDFEFNQSTQACAVGRVNKVRTTDDLLIEYSIVQGGARAIITVRKWSGSAWGPADVFTANEATGTTNTTQILAANTGGVSDVSLNARTFGEASIDLDALFDDEKCTSFGSAMLKSRSSDSFTSQLKDFIAPLPINLSNCAQVIIRKETTPPGATELFDFTKSFATDPASANTFQLADGDDYTKGNVLLGEDLTVAEDADLPNGWEFDSVDCDDSTDVDFEISGQTVTFDLDATTDVLDCTFYNSAKASLTVVKKVNDAPGGQAFAFVATGSGLSNFSLTPTATGDAGADSEDFTNLAPGAYSVAETVPDGWNLASATCDNGNAPGAITLAAGSDVTCTFTNERERGAIEITKTRKHAAAPGGEGAHAGVTFTVSGNGITPVVVQTNAQGIACVPNLLYGAGAYTVTETVPDNYVSDDAVKEVAVSAEGTCSTGTQAEVSFVNTPLTDVTVSVDSLVDGGTASTITCVDGAGVTVVEDPIYTPGDTSVTAEDLEPTYPATTLVCTIIVDP
jgi:hypothetical protein